MTEQEKAKMTGREKEGESFYRTIIESQEWSAWEKHVNRNIHLLGVKPVNTSKLDLWDISESVECDLISHRHFKAFMDFVRSWKGRYLVWKERRNDPSR